MEAIFKKINTKIEFIVLKKNERWLKVINYWIQKNYKVERKIDITKWDEDFDLFVIDINE